MTYTQFAVETQATEVGAEVRQTWSGSDLVWAQNAARIKSGGAAPTAIVVGIRADGTEDVLEGWYEGQRTHTAAGWAPAASHPQHPSRSGPASGSRDRGNDMQQSELTARAIQRAHDEHVYIRRTAREGVYSTVSKSDPTARYTLVAIDGVLGCSCKGFEYRRCCKHSEALRNRLAREAARRPANVTTLQAA